MKITKTEHTIRDLTKGYADNQEEGVVGFDGKLDIRPPYQREFVYKEQQRAAVIDTVTNGFPLNIMYWNTKHDGTFEVLDGQQRTISICQYVDGVFSVDGLYFHNQPDDKQKQFLDYKLDIYQCDGADSERINWFRVINVAGEPLTEQEIRNAVYCGTWTHDAKRHFSKTNCPAYQIGKDFLKGVAIRQDYLETAIKWHAAQQGGKTIEDYMGKHMHDENAQALWKYFQDVIEWVEAVFIKEKKDRRTKEMKGVAWGELFNGYGKEKLDNAAIRKEVDRLMEDNDVTNNAGIYRYVLNGNEKYLNIRPFDDNIKRTVYEKQGGVCNNPKCQKDGKRLDIQEMEADHITPWSEGGKTQEENCQMLCRDCNRKKGAK